MTIPNDSSESPTVPVVDPREPPTVTFARSIDTQPLLTSIDHERPPNDTILLVFGADQIETVAVPIGNAITLGREHASNRLQPEVNLARYNGLSTGISRRHATIRHDTNGWWIVDLDSSNGSWLGRVSLAPAVPYCLGKVNEVRLGRLDFRIVVLGHGCQSIPQDQDAADTHS
jgi:hypothetical protein